MDLARCVSSSRSNTSAPRLLTQFRQHQRRAPRLFLCEAGTNRTTYTTPSLVRLELGGMLDSMEVMRDVSDIMCEEAFVSNSWDFDDPSDETSLEGMLERRMYKARFMAGALRKVAIGRRNEFVQILMIEGDQAMGDPDLTSGVLRPLGDASQLPSDSILAYADLSVEELDEETTGALSVASGLRGCIVRNFIVRQDVRRRGLGTELAKGCLEAARDIMAEESDVVACVLQVYQQNEAAIALYEAAGFSVLEEWEDKDWLAGLDSGAIGPARKLLMAAET